MAEGISVGVREDVNAMVQVDCAKLAARVARQSRVTSRMDVASTYALAHLEGSHPQYFSALGSAFREHARNGTRNERRRGLWRAWRRSAVLNFRASDQPALNHLICLRKCGQAVV